MALEFYKPEEATRSRGGIAVLLTAILGYGVFSLYEWLAVGMWQQDLSGGWLGDEFPISPRVVLCMVLMVVLAVGIYYLCNKPNIVDFLISTEDEMGKVSWASQQEVITSSAVVVVTVVILAGYLGVVDYGLVTFKNEIPWNDIWDGVLGGGSYVAKKWFVLRVGTNREKRVKKQLWSRIQTHDLQDMISEILVVTEKVTEIKGGNRRTVERKVYPGYVMAEIEVDEETGKIPPEVWHLIRETPGQVKFVNSSPDEPDRPMPLSDDEVAKIQRQQQLTEAEDGQKVTIDFEVGERVRIREGSFENFEGSVEEVSADKGMVKVSIMVFGRPTPIDFECWKVEKVED